MHFLCTKAVEQIAHYESRFILIADMEVKMDKLYLGCCRNFCNRLVY